jgi:predicted DNA-binding WGR domain protein
MRKFKFVDDQSDKFWNLELSGSSYTVSYGRIGTKGQSKTKDFGTPAAAQKAYSCFDAPGDDAGCHS